MRGSELQGGEERAGAECVVLGQVAMDWSTRVDSLKDGLTPAPDTCPA